MSDMTLEQARKVIDAHHEAERKAERQENLKLVGKFYKYRNSYGGAVDGWWLYATVIGVDKFGSIRALTFERTSTDEISIRADSMRPSLGNGWSEISASEFWKAASKLKTTISKLLTERRK